MLFIINAEGTVQKTFPSQVYQGSNDASDIIVLAPIVQAAMADVGFMLPNGAWTTPYIMASNGPIELEGVSYNTWRTLLPYAITEYSGTVTAQFRFYTGAGADPQTAQVVTTAAATFAVQTGAAIQLPDAPTDDVYEQILAALTNVNSDISKLREDTDAKVPLAGNGDAQRAYTAAQDGSTVMMPISTGADADTLAMRTADGAVEVADPVKDSDAVNLGYLKQNGYALAQETGQQTNVAMSQKATTDALFETESKIKDATANAITGKKRGVEIIIPDVSPTEYKMKVVAPVAPVGSTVVKYGLNLWDEGLTVGYYLTSAGEAKKDPNQSVSTNYIPVKAGVEMYFCSTKNLNVCFYSKQGDSYTFVSRNSLKNASKIYNTDGYIRFSVNATSYEGDICISVYDTATNGTYEPYKEAQTYEVGEDGIVEIEPYFPVTTLTTYTTGTTIECEYNKDTNKVIASHENVEMFIDITALTWTNNGQVGPDETNHIAWSASVPALSISTKYNGYIWSIFYVYIGGAVLEESGAVVGTDYTNGYKNKLYIDGSNLTIVNATNPADYYNNYAASGVRILLLA